MDLGRILAYTFPERPPRRKVPSSTVGIGRRRETDTDRPRGERRCESYTIQHLRGNWRAKRKPVLADEPENTPYKGLERAIYSVSEKFDRPIRGRRAGGAILAVAIYDQNEGPQAPLSLQIPFSFHPILQDGAPE